jgi:hypothetical protein
MATVQCENAQEEWVLKIRFPKEEGIWMSFHRNLKFNMFSIFGQSLQYCLSTRHPRLWKWPHPLCNCSSQKQDIVLILTLLTCTVYTFLYILPSIVTIFTVTQLQACLISLGTTTIASF